MPVAKKVATATCHHPPKKCRSPKKWRPGRAIALARDAGRQKNGDRDVAALPKRQGDCLGRVLGHLGCLLKPLGCLLGRLGRHLGASWGHLGTSWGGLWASWERLGGLLGAPLEKYRKNDRGIKVLDSSWEPNWKPKSKKIDVKKRVLYDMSFFSIFVKFSLILAPPNQPNLIQFPFQTQE